MARLAARGERTPRLPPFLPPERTVSFLRDFNINDPYFVVPVLMGLMVVIWIVALFSDRPPE
jgi:hypothetical protein